MNVRYPLTIVIAALLCAISSHAKNTWRPVAGMQVGSQAPLIRATSYLVYTVDEADLRSQLLSAGSDASTAQNVEVPMPDGSIRTFRVWQTPILPEPLASKFPGIKTFTGVAADNPAVTAKFDFTVYGFHMMVFDGGNVSFIDPYDNSASGVYTVHYKRDEIRHWNEVTKCNTVSPPRPVTERAMNLTGSGAMRTSNGYQLRTYRLALSCSHQYAQTATSLSSPLVSQVFSKMVTTMNRVNGVYERELSITMTFVAKEDTLIDTSAVADTFSAINGNAGACLAINQAVCDAKIGDTNYDIGHVFTTNAGGLSEIGVVCQSYLKAQSVTGQPTPVGDGFDIDYVAHEMGHEYGGEHTFNSGDGNCGGQNLNPPTAYEPGSGSTIMAYAGICSPDDLQPHSDDYFHAISLMEIEYYIATRGDVCAHKTATGNKLAGLASFSTLYNIPYKTPFELTAPAATDSVGDTQTTYCWEEWDLGDLGETLLATHDLGPIFRSYRPTKSPTRVFPKDTMVLAGILSNAGKEDNEGEKAPDTARILTFKLTVRDIYNGNGCFLIPDDSIVLNVVNTGSGFTVTSQADSGAKYIGGLPQDVTWNVANTNKGAVNAANVDIYMSDDGGYTWPYHIGTFPNTGSASVPLPNPPTDVAAARLKVKGSGNVFFNVNKCNFAVVHGDATDTTISLYPVPAHSTLRIYTGNKGQQQFAIYNIAGKLMYQDTVYGIYDVAVNLWPRGEYIVRMVDPGKHRTVKKFVVE